MHKYQFKPDRYSSHSKILNFMKRQKPASVLDIGCAQGFISHELTRLGFSVTGIDINKESVDAAKEFCKEAIIGDIETMKLPFTDKFDYIVLSDVLEHLKDPNAAMKKILPHLKDAGVIVVSIPNVANIYVRLTLLIGRFDYTDRGLLDKTHLRFFTLKTLKAMIIYLRLRIVKLMVTPIPLPLVFSFITEGKPLYFIHKLLHGLTNLWKTLFAYQFIVILKKN